MKNKKKILMHACCGPCTLEPYRLLLEDGWDITIYYANGNIFPEAEFDKRLATLQAWAAENEATVIVEPYDNDAWCTTAGKLAEAEPNTPERKNRCRHCYCQRFEKTAAYAAEHGFNVIGTTLSVSPYQYTKIIEEELERAAAARGLRAHFVDFTPHYRDATLRSRELGMYRQDYCGCDFSHRESIAQQKARKVAKAAKKAENLEKERATREQATKRAKERAAYNKKQQRKKQLLKEYKSKNLS